MEKSVSIIIPAYNVEKYIDRCIQSVISQTYEDIEIIIVNDGSTDGTAEKCESWAKMDERIVYISKENEGQGIARNMAINKANTEYLIFVDSDDWIEQDYVEKLYSAIKERQHDIVVCDWIRVDERTGKEEKFSQNFKQSNLNSRVNNIELSLWGKIFRKGLFLENKIEQPSHFFEDIAIVPYLLVISKNISYVEGCHYFYLRRYTSTANGIKSLDDRAIALETLIKLFEDNNLFQEYKEPLETIIMKRCRADLSATKRIFKEKYTSIFKQHQDIVKGNFNISLVDVVEKGIAVWGSYNLYRVAKIMMASEVEYRFMASSLISVTSGIIPQLNDIALNNSNEFRGRNVIYDCTKRFMYMNPAEFKSIQVFLIDFLEERFPIGFYKGNYVTISDSYEELSNINLSLERVSDANRIVQWEIACQKFVERIQKYFSNAKIVLIRMKLAEYYGDSGKQEKYNNLEEIRNINRQLDFYYNYFLEMCPNAIEISVEEESYYYTDRNFKHGCKPWHLNQQAYYNIFRKIQNRIEELYD